MRRILIVLALALAVAMPARAQDEYITIHFGVGYEAASTSAACELSVLAGTDGSHVLAAARANGCLRSYRTLNYPSGTTLVRCVDGACSTQYYYGHYTVCTEDGCRDICPTATGECVPNLLLTWWRFSANETLYQFNINEYRAAEGDEVRVGFTFGI